MCGVFKNFQINLCFAWLPPAIRPGSAMRTGAIFLTNNVSVVYNTNPFWKRFIHCPMVIPFIIQWASLFFSKVSNSQKKVLITPVLYFPNYCIMYYLPCDISRDFKKCEHMNLWREWTHAIFEESLSSLESVRIYCQRISSVY